MSTRKIYLASSWRNAYYPQVLKDLQAIGHEVYDFRDPEGAFKWSAIAPDYYNWKPRDFRKALNHPEAFRGFQRDIQAMQWCDTCVLLLPSGKSAHLELGWCCGAKKDCYIYLPPEEAKMTEELMYKMVGQVNKRMLFNLEELKTRLEQPIIS